MGDFLRRVIWFAVLCAAIYAAYVAYIRWWDNGTVARKGQEVQQYVTKKVGEVKTQAEEKTKEYTSEVVGEAKKTLLDAIKEQVSGALTGIGKGIVHSAESIIGVSSTDALPPITAAALSGNASGTMVVPAGAEYLAPAPPATLISRVGAPLTFSINRGTTYTANWGDGARDTGAVDQESVKLISHSWAREGDYQTTISVKGNGVSQDYLFPIRIFP